MSAPHIADRVLGDVPCCDLHGRNCEPPSELCCQHCTEASHPDHADGSACWSPDLSSTVRVPPIDRLVADTVAIATTLADLMRTDPEGWHDYQQEWKP